MSCKKKPVGQSLCPATQAVKKTPIKRTVKKSPIDKPVKSAKIPVKKSPATKDDEPIPIKKPPVVETIIETPSNGGNETISAPKCQPKPNFVIQRGSVPVLSKYEWAKVMSERVLDIVDGKPTTVQITGTSDPIKIVFQEYRESKIPKKIIRE